MAEITQFRWDLGKVCANSGDLREALLPMFDGPDEWIKILNPKSVLVGRGSKKATIVIQSKGTIVAVSPGSASVQGLIAISVAIGYIAIIPGLVLSFLVQVPYIKRHSHVCALACMGVIVGLNATPNDTASNSSKLFDHVDPATWKQVEMEYHASKEKMNYHQSTNLAMNSQMNLPPSSPQISPHLLPPPSSPSIQSHVIKPNPPPESWIGNLGDDGYEYIEYPDDSGITYYRYQGESQWKVWSDNESQISHVESPPAQPFLSPPITQPSLSPPVLTPPGPTPPLSTPVLAPPGLPPGLPPTPLSNNRPAFTHSTIPASPRRDRFATMDNSFGFSERKSRKGLKFTIGVIFVLGLLVIVPGILYVWASDLAGDSVGDSYFSEDDDDGDGVPDGSDNCVYDYNPSQDNFDGDSDGDACDADIDNDGYLNSNDFYDYGDGVLVFKWTYARIDDSETYDSDGSGPDVYARLSVDWDSDGSTDSTYTSTTTNNIKEWPNLWEKELNPSDNRDQIKITVRLYDDDYSSDDELDYVSGTYDYYTFTVPLYESKYDSNTYDGRDGYKGLKVTFVFEVDSS